MTATSDDKDALLRGALIFLQDSQEQLKLDGRRNQELILRCQHLVIGITAALAEQSAPPAPELPEPVATPRTDEAEMPIDRVDTIASRPCGIVNADFSRQLERELTAERERAERAERERDAWENIASAENERARKAESRLSAAVALLREHGEVFDVIKELTGGNLSVVVALNAKREEFLRGIE